MPRARPTTDTMFRRKEADSPALTSEVPTLPAPQSGGA